MKELMLALLVVLMVEFAHSQVIISGKVVNHRKNPLYGVSISIRDSYDGATTDSMGRFKFSTEEKGQKLLVASSLGYKSSEQTIEIGATDIVLEISLREEINELKAVVITAGTFEASDRKKATVLNPIDIVTTASANGDVTGALKTLPGAQLVGEKEGLFVRGGASTESKIFIDGNLVNNFFYSSVPHIAQFGRFSPFLFKGTVFSTGGYSALYGQALSSVLILESIDLPERTSANLSATILGLQGGYQHLAKNKKSSWGAEYGYTNLALAFKLIKQKQDYTQAPEYHNADANFRIMTSKTGMIKYYGYFSANRLGYFVPSIDTIGYQDGFGLRNFNMYHNLSYKEKIGRNLRLYAGLSYTKNKDKIKSGLYTEDENEVMLEGLLFKSYNVNNDGDYFNAKLVLEKRLKGLSVVRIGTEYNYSNDQSEYTLSHNGEQYEALVKENTNALFAETDVYLTNEIAAKFGARLEHSTLLDKTNIAPRISLAYKLGRSSQVSMAYGIFYQNPDKRYLPSMQSLDFTKAAHYIAQFQKVSSLITFRAEVFYKKYKGLLKTNLVNSGQQLATGNEGFGEARGFEFFWRDKKTIKSFDYWISYSFLDTERDYLNFPYAIQPDFTSRHTMSLVMKKFVTNWKTGFNASYNYNSGRPYYFIAPDGNNGQFKFTDKGETIDYHNVSFSLNYIPGIGKQNPKAFAVYVISVSNIFGFDQVYGYQYSYNGVRKEAIVPPSKTFVFVGAFISFGIDRTEDAINNNL